MNQSERDALREKHKQMFWYCGFCDFPYPCDVIKVLDATESDPDCDHWVTVNRSGHYGYASDTTHGRWTHTFCPKCGEKL